MIDISVNILLKGLKGGNTVSINESISFDKTEDFGYKIMVDCGYFENQITKILKEKIKYRINELSISILNELSERHDTHFHELIIKKINIKKI